MPHFNKMGPTEDPYRSAATHVLQGDPVAAWEAVSDIIKSNTLEAYDGPQDDSDEDGEKTTDPRTDIAKIMGYEIDVAIDATADAVYEILTSRGTSDDEAMKKADSVRPQVEGEWRKREKALASDVASEWADGAAYSADPYRYHGVKRSDF